MRALWTDLIISIPWDKQKNLYSQERVVLLLVRGSFFTENIGVNISTSQGVQDIRDCGSSSCFWRNSFLRFLHKENRLILVFTEFTRPLHVNLKISKFCQNIFITPYTRNRIQISLLNLKNIPEAALWYFARLLILAS